MVVPSCLYDITIQNSYLHSKLLLFIQSGVYLNWTFLKYLPMCTEQRKFLGPNISNFLFHLSKPKSKKNERLIFIIY